MPLLKEKTYTIDDIYTLPEGERAELIDGSYVYDGSTEQKTSAYFNKACQYIDRYHMKNIKEKPGLCGSICGLSG